MINQAVRQAAATVHSEFRVYNSADIPKLRALLASGLTPMDHGFATQEIVAPPLAA